MENKHLVLSCLLITLFSIALSAADLNTNQYIFIDTHTNISGTSDQPMMAIDFPTYGISSGALRSQVAISLTDLTQVIVGGGISLGGEVGMGAATGLKLYDSLTKDGEFVIDAGGAAQYYYEGQWISLAPGQSWTQTIETTAYRGFTGQLIVKHTVTNYGVLSKSNITAPNLGSPTPTNTPTRTATGTSVSITCGDVNNDGQFNIVDALMIAQYAVGLTVSPFYPERADVNKDGTINIVDALIVAQYYVGLVTNLVCS